jgi:putative protease
MMQRKDFEIMAPVGSYESLTAAIQGGADSVYFGVEGLNMRSRSSNNFTLDDLRNIAEICNQNNINYDAWKQIIISTNNISDVDKILEGQTILIPIVNTND